MTWTEFNNLTLAEFEALEDRRAVALRHSRFNAALITATIFNAHRSSDSEPVEVWDFLSGYERTEEERTRERHRKEMRRTVGTVLSRVATEPMETVRNVTARLIQRLSDNGIEDPKALILEVFPSMELSE